jgi:hypothetical protein
MAVTRYKLQQPLGPSRLHKDQDTTILQMHVDGGEYLILGRVAFFNWDSDTQRAAAKILAIGATDAVDWVEITLAGDPVGESISLQGLFKCDIGQRLELVCSTYNGSVSAASLIAMPIDTFALGRD